MDDGPNLALRLKFNEFLLNFKKIKAFNIIAQRYVYFLLLLSLNGFT